MYWNLVYLALTTPLSVPKMGVIPNWIVYKGKPTKMDDLGVPLFQETSMIYSWMEWGWIILLVVILDWFRLVITTRKFWASALVVSCLSTFCHQHGGSKIAKLQWFIPHYPTLFGGFHKWGYPKMDGWKGKIPLKFGWFRGSPISGNLHFSASATPILSSSNLQGAQIRSSRRSPSRSCLWKKSPVEIQWNGIRMGSEWSSIVINGKHWERERYIYI